MSIFLSNRTFSHEGTDLNNDDLAKTIYNTFKLFIDNINPKSKSIEVLIGAYTDEEDNLVPIEELETIEPLEGTYYLIEMKDSLNKSHSLEINHIGFQIILYISSDRQTKKQIMDYLLKSGMEEHKRAKLTGIFEFRPDGTVNMFALCLLEDYKHDYQYFKEQAIKYKDSGEEFLYKRYIRVAFIYLYLYFEGVVSAWIREIETKEGKINLNFRDKQNFYICMDYLLDKALGKGGGFEKLKAAEFCKAKQLRNKIIHYNVSDSDEYLGGNGDRSRFPPYSYIFTIISLDFSFSRKGVEV